MSPLHVCVRCGGYWIKNGWRGPTILTTCEKCTGEITVKDNGQSSRPLLCPLLTIAQGFVDSCVRWECEWWDVDKKQCFVFSVIDSIREAKV